MDLFNTQQGINLLPYEGETIYHGRIMTAQEATSYLNQLLNTIAWQHDEAIVFGKRITTKRMAAWYGDEAYTYTYSGITKRAIGWTPELAALKLLAQQITGATYNSCLLNLYHNGDEGMGWHADAEKEIQKDSAIASISFGTERKFALKHKQTQFSTSVLLEHGSLLVMQGTTQTHWLHTLPKTKKVTQPRVNLTFRTINT